VIAHVRRRSRFFVALFAGAMSTGSVGARDIIPPPAVSPPAPEALPFEPKYPIEARVKLGECEPYTQDDAIVVERLAGGGLRVSQCLVGYGEWIPTEEVRVLQQGGRLRISFLDHSRPYEHDDAVPGCSSTLRLIVEVDTTVAPVTSVSIEGWRVRAEGTTSTTLSQDAT
jgi:hypothetical protein